VTNDSKGKLTTGGQSDGVVGYDDVLASVVSLLESARRASARAINTVMTATYWQIGQRIVEHEQGGADRATYGERLLAQLSADLTSKFGTCPAFGDTDGRSGKEGTLEAAPWVTLDEESWDKTVTVREKQVEEPDAALDTGGEQVRPDFAQSYVGALLFTALLLLLAATACDNDELTEERALHVFGTKEVCWTDPASGLTWQIWPLAESNYMNWSTAKAHCRDLDLAGHTDWHLPTIGELRSLIRGCPGTELGGSCKVGETGCLSGSCEGPGDCLSCSVGGGPADGSYWPDEMQGVDKGYWSSTITEGGYNDLGWAWTVTFHDGTVGGDHVNYEYRARCVR